MESDICRLPETWSKVKKALCNRFWRAVAKINKAFVRGKNKALSLVYKQKHLNSIGWEKMYLSAISLEKIQGIHLAYGSGHSEWKTPKLSMDLGFGLPSPLRLQASLQGALCSHGQSSRAGNVCWSPTSGPIMGSI